VRREKLQRRVPVELRVAGFIHDAHAALAELFEDGIMGYGLTDHR